MREDMDEGAKQIQGCGGEGAGWKRGGEEKES